jgi:cystathionine gamma-synthase/methionine-gamma-lyase
VKPKSFQTQAVHAGERAPRPDYTPVVNPIHPSVGFLYDSIDDLDAVFAGTKNGYVYPRYGSPTISAFETAIAELEDGEAAFSFATGMAAIHVALLAAGVKAGTTVVAAQDLYGATFTLLNRLFSSLGVKVIFLDFNDFKTYEKTLVETRPVAVMAETISNPLVKVIDIPALTDIAHRYGAKVLIDNTFASPYLCKPLAYGVDYSIHSATKYIAGHGDVMAGIVISSTENRNKMFEFNKLVGSTLGPFEAWLAMRGLKTLPLRMRQQCDNAARIAEWLTNHPMVSRVHYPGLKTHPQHELALRQFGQCGFGGMLSFEIAQADRAKAFRFMESLKLCLPATTLGDIYTLVLHPATTSHRALTSEDRLKIGIREGLVRLSAGIEDANDIIADLDQAFKRCPQDA